jgi:hypothetical protein
LHAGVVGRLPQVRVLVQCVAELGPGMDLRVAALCRGHSESGDALEVGGAVVQGLVQHRRGCRLEYVIGRSDYSRTVLRLQRRHLIGRHASESLATLHRP